MQHLQASNLLAAEEYLLTSYQTCKGDPLVLNELGVLYYNKQKYVRGYNFYLSIDVGIKLSLSVIKLQSAILRKR